MLRPVAVLWSLLLAALLALLPCAANAATTSTPPAGPVTSVQAVPAVPAADAVADRPGAPAAHQHARAADGTGLRILCTADGPSRIPGHGCSSHSFCGPESQLPNAPPQPGAVVLPQLVAPSASPAVPAHEVRTGPHHAPDLHVLQVHRS
ncbi:hypothetical protein [Kitasatospora cheerisanensis]|uniref:Secreted protein n=1 Tax=Kitasatospora cheerisanensis KCTC 2395 TaxID=1348663 RepID=A0A066Z1T9_9ACTN|nr:hypothetical protein [Kitasatospora cheerisanensis]KDN86174.1 hypothetical protein KCH_19910 [Kitasatospora cheerisanensis KCTC 2395]